MSDEQEQTVVELDEEDVAAQAALEQQLADLEKNEQPDTEEEPIAAEAKEEVVDSDISAVEQDMQRLLDDIQQYFDDPVTEDKASVQTESKPTVTTKEVSSGLSEAELKLRELEHQMDLVKKVLVKEHEEKQKIQKEQEVFNKLQTFMNHSITLARKAHDDYDDAANHYIESRVAHYNALSDIYPDSATKEGALKYVHDELGRLISVCAKNKTNPAEQLYKMAKKLGYKPSEEPKATVSKADVSNVQRVNFAQKATKTLSSTNGVGVTSSEIPTNEDEYDEWIKDPANQALIQRRMTIKSY